MPRPQVLDDTVYTGHMAKLETWERSCRCDFMPGGGGGHHALFVSGEGEAHVEIFYFLECRERKGKGLGEGQLFKLLLIFLCVCVYAGGSGYMPACLSAH